MNINLDNKPILNYAKNVVPVISESIKNYEEIHGKFSALSEIKKEILFITKNEIMYPKEFPYLTFREVKNNRDIFTESLPALVFRPDLRSKIIYKDVIKIDFGYFSTNDISLIDKKSDLLQYFEKDDNIGKNGTTKDNLGISLFCLMQGDKNYLDFYTRRFSNNFIDYYKSMRKFNFGVNDLKDSISVLKYMHWNEVKLNIYNNCHKSKMAQTLHLKNFLRQQLQDLHVCPLTKYITDKSLDKSNTCRVNFEKMLIILYDHHKNIQKRILH